MNKFTFFLILVSLLFTASCSDDSFASNLESDTGIGGSYARFLALNDHLYVVDDSSIKTFNLTNAAEPEQIDKQEIGERIESIFHFDGRLFGQACIFIK